MRTTIRLTLTQRAVIFRDGLPHEALGPGVHHLWRAEPQRLVFDTDELVFTAPAAVRAVLPAEWFATVEIGPRERGVLMREGQAVRRLAPGVHRHWTLDGEVQVIRVDLDAAPPTDERILDLLGGEVLRTIVGEHQRGLLFRQGRLDRVLAPGRHVLWNLPDAPTSVGVVDMRRQLLQVTGQELMTKDKVTLRLSLTVEWAPRDPALHQRAAADPQAAVHSLAQLALRDFVAGVTLDELLEQRAALTTFLEGRVIPEAEQMGVRVSRIGVKDVMLPGEMKALMNRVIEAEKEAAANGIRRREQVAETRAQANAAQLMADRPVLMRLKELETMRAVAEGIQELKVVVGNGGVEQLLGQLIKAK